MAGPVSVAVEFVTPSVTSPVYSETIALSGAPQELAAIDGVLYFSARTFDEGREPWKHVP